MNESDAMVRALRLQMATTPDEVGRKQYRDLIAMIRKAQTLSDRYAAIEASMAHYRALALAAADRQARLALWLGVLIQFTLVIWPVCLATILTLWGRV